MVDGEGRRESRKGEGEGQKIVFKKSKICLQEKETKKREKRFYKLQILFPSPKSHTPKKRLVLWGWGA